MINGIRINPDANWLIYGLPALVIISAILVSMNASLMMHPEMAAAVAFDMAISAPIIHLFLIRKKKVSKLGALWFFSAGLILASFVLPEENQYFLGLIKTFALPAIEVFVISYLGFLIYRAFRDYRSLSKGQYDAYQVIREVCFSNIGSPILARLLSSEIALLYYAFFSWRAPRPERGFSYHKKNGTTALYFVAIFLVLAETTAAHILVSKWSAIAAWLLTASSIYLILLILAHLKASRQRRIEIRNDKVFIRYGLFGDAEIDFENIESAILSKEEYGNEKGLLKLSLLGDFEPHNIRLILKKKGITKGFYGITREFDKLLFYLDDPEEFLKDFEKKSNSKGI